MRDTRQVNSRFVPQPDSCIAATASLFDHLVGGRQNRRRNCKTQRLCGFEIDHQIEFRRLLNRQISRLGSSRDEIDVLCGTTLHHGEAWSVGQQSARVHDFAKAEHRYNPIAQREVREAVPVTKKEARR
jgi:hypothetical protein